VAAAPLLVVGVDDTGCGPTAIVDAAKLEASRTYCSIGVSVVWAAESKNIGDSLEGDLALTVVLLSQVRTDTFLFRRRLSRTALGVAPDGTRRVYIFCGRIVRRAKRTGEKMGTILGRVIAHELGHQLLPGNGHSTIGIMRASLDYTTEEPLRFTDAETASILALLAASR
jgi:hypothetical protein